jgi:hypothetical protein
MYKALIIAGIWEGCNENKVGESSHCPSSICLDKRTLQNAELGMEGARQASSPFSKGFLLM